MTYEQNLRLGTFCMVWCNTCKDMVWPPSRYCSVCMSNTVTVPCRDKGTLVEFSIREHIKFGICRFGKMSIMGEITSKSCFVGMSVVVSRCGINEAGPFYEFKDASM